MLDDFDSMLATAQAARTRAFPEAANRRLTEDERSEIRADPQARVTRHAAVKHPRPQDWVPPCGTSGARCDVRKYRVP